MATEAKKITASEPTMRSIQTAIRKDIKAKVANITRDEARYLVKTYYQIQDYRKAMGLQAASLVKADKPSEIIELFGGHMEDTEANIKVALKAFADNHPMGQWMQKMYGVGPVIAAGFLAYIDIYKADTAGKIHAYAGLDPTREWNAGEKRPWNADLKVLCWKLGESFVKVCNKEDSYYGQLYKQRKEYETAKNEKGDYKEQAERQLRIKKYSKDTEAYQAYIQGKLPKGHINERCKRYAVKMFISHMHQIWREMEGLPCPAPYVIAHMGHVDFIDPHTIES